MDIALPGLEVKGLLRTPLWSSSPRLYCNGCHSSSIQPARLLSMLKETLILAIKKGSLNFACFVAVQAQLPENNLMCFILKRRVFQNYQLSKHGFTFMTEMEPTCFSKSSSLQSE